MKSKKNRSMTSAAVGALLEVKIEALDDAARGTGQTAEGHEVHVPGGLPGESVRAEVEFVDRFGRHHARLVEVLEASPERAKETCPHGACADADLGHASLALQHTWKRSEVARALELDEAKVDPVVHSPRATGWLTRLRLFAGEGGVLGARAERSRGADALEDRTGCLLHAPEAERIADAIRSLILRSREPVTGLVAVTIVASISEGRALVVLHVVPDVENVDGLGGVLAMRSDVAFVGKAFLEPGIEVGAEPELEVIADKGRVVESIGGVSHLLVPAGFAPENPLAAGLVRARLVELLKPAGERVLDLYAGAGGLTHALAGAGATVMAIEAHHGAVELARRAGAASEGGAAVTYVESSAEDGVRAALERQESFASVVLDPPKKGASRGVLDDAAALSPHRIAYVGRDLRTLARDIGVLTRADRYEVARVTVVDVAPGTRGFEAIVLLTRKV